MKNLFSKVIFMTSIFVFNTLMALAAPPETPTGAVLSGDLMRWHKVTLSLDGPNTNETATDNPFLNYRLDVTFTHTDGKSFTIPGYYAGCEDATGGCTSGNLWKVHFSPDRTGDWSYSISFTSGTNVAVNGGGSSAGFVDGKTGSFTIEESNKTGRDHRASNKGRLQYVGEHYLRYTGTGGNTPNGDWFFKAGADAPENTLAYNDFDATPNRGNRRKTWSPHQQDYNATDASAYTWGSGKGTELLGVVNYFAKKNLNAFSFLTLSLHGDDENVFPHLMKVNESTYNGYNDAQQWNNGVHHTRFDVSKLAQWERIFEYADKKGVFMHFKTMETENDNIMDDNTNGIERKLYYRELIARFSHHLALNWNITEETTIPDNVVKSIATYIKDVDPYDHHIVLHTYPGQKSQRYTPLLGNNSNLTGASLQSDKSKVHNDVIEWRQKSADAGKKWAIANDEQGSAQVGVDADPTDNTLVRKEVLWGTLLGGGFGVEYYYGYGTGETDLTAQDHRSRDTKYTHASHALAFFKNYFQQYLPNTINNDGLTGDNNDYVLEANGQAYAIYRPSGGSTAISLSGDWQVQWYNPRTGGNLSAPVTLGNNLIAPDNNDWVALVTSSSGPLNQLPTVNFTAPDNNETFTAPHDLIVTVDANDVDGTIENVSLYLDGSLVRTDATAPYSWGSSDAALQNLSAGTYELKAIAMDDSGATAEKVISIRVLSENTQEIVLFPIHDAYLQGSTRFNTTDLRVEDGNRVTYFMFDLSAIEGDMISASLQVAVGSDAGSGNININLGTSNSWTENTLTTSNAPSSGDLLGSLNTAYSLGNTYEWSLSNFTLGDNVSFIMTQVGGNDVSFISKEGSIAPKLVIQYEENTTTVDCNGDFNGTASIDDCGICSGGNTGITPSSPTTWYADTDGDGLGDTNNSLEDCEQPAGYVAIAGDNCPTDANKTEPGTCGCGLADTDTDSDGIADCEDECPTDATNSCNVITHTIAGLIQAEEFSDQTGVETEETSDIDGGDNIGFIHNGDQTVYQVNVLEDGTYDVEIRVASNTTGGTISITDGSSELTVVSVSNTNGWQEWETINAQVELLTSTTSLHLDFIGGTGYLFNINWLNFTKVIDQPTDCNGDVNGTASIDPCGVCSGGNTGITPSSPTTWYADIDGDGVGDTNDSVEDCEQPTGYVAISGDNCPTDADKTEPGNCGCGVQEGACLDCNGDVNGTASIDDCGICSGGNTGITPSSPSTWYADIDGDGVGDTNDSVEDCEQPTGYVAISGDECPIDADKTEPGNCGCGVQEGTCLDCNGDVNGTASIDSCGVCSGGNTGITPSSPSTWYADIDGDGVGDTNDSVEDCEQPTGYVAISGDNCPTDADKTEPGNCGCGVQEGTCDVTCDATPYNSTVAYSVVGTQVEYEGKLYENKWYTLGNTPGLSGGPWKLVGFCGADPLDCSGLPAWSSSATYSASGTLITYEGNQYSNLYYSQNQVPGLDEVWEYKGPCAQGATKLAKATASPNPLILGNTVFISFDEPIINATWSLTGQLGQEINTGSLEDGATSFSLTIDNESHQLLYLIIRGDNINEVIRIMISN